MGSVGGIGCADVSVAAGRNPKPAAGDCAARSRPPAGCLAHVRVASESTTQSLICCIVHIDSDTKMLYILLQ